MSFCKQQYNSNVMTTGQRGFVLVLSLVLLSVLTLIGVSSMNSANLELRATANAQHHHIAFNAAQAVLEYAVSEPADAIIKPPPPGQIDWQTINPVPQTPNLSGVAILNLPKTSNMIATVSFIGCSVGLGSSLQAGKGLSNNFFTVATSASNSSGTATSLQSLGVRYPAASCPDIVVP